MFKESPRIREIAEKIISKYHPHLQDAIDVIGFYVRSDGGVDWAGKAKKCTSFERDVTGRILFVFILHSAFENWPPEKLEALIDHELCHIRRKTGTIITDPNTMKVIKREWAKKDDPDNWYIQDHDVEEFSDVIRRHGLWDQGVERFAEAVREVEYQMTIFDAAAEEQKLRAVK